MLESSFILTLLMATIKNVLELKYTTKVNGEVLGLKKTNKKEHKDITCICPCWWAAHRPFTSAVHPSSN